MTCPFRTLPPARRAIASRSYEAYFPAMPVASILRFLLLLAVLLAPISMMSSHAAMALPAEEAGAMGHHEMSPAPGGHCADMAPASEDEPADGASPVKNIDCTIACSCVPPAAGQIAQRPPYTPGVERPGLAALLVGVSPEAEPRPPQSS